MRMRRRRVCLGLNLLKPKPAHCGGLRAKVKDLGLGALFDHGTVFLVMAVGQGPQGFTAAADPHHLPVCA
jgi:hypothetical protein